MLKGQEQFQRSGRGIANLGYIVSVEVAGVTEEDTAPKPDKRERRLGREGEIVYQTSVEVATFWSTAWELLSESLLGHGKSKLRDR